MDVDPSPEEVLGSTYLQPKVSEAATILRSPRGAAKEEEAHSSF